MPERPTMWLREGALGKMVLVDLEPEFNHAGNRSIIPMNWSPSKNSGHQFGTPPGSWVAMLCIVSHAEAKKEMTQGLCPEPFQALPCVTFLLADFDLYPFPVTNCNCGDNSVWVLWVLLRNYQTSQWFRESFASWFAKFFRLCWYFHLNSYNPPMVHTGKVQIPILQVKVPQW